MPEFNAKPPIVVVHSMDETIAALKTIENHPERFRIRSDWLIELIDEHVSTGRYPYNDDILKLAILRAKGRVQIDDVCGLETLVYNAQRYRRQQHEDAAGWRSVSTELLAELEGQTVDVLGENMLGGDAVATARVRRVGGALRLMKPKARRRCYIPEHVKIRAQGGSRV